MNDLDLWLSADEYLSGRLPQLPEHADEQPTRADAAQDNEPDLWTSTTTTATGRP